MAMISFRWTGDGVARLKTAAAALADRGKRDTAFRRALNHTGNKHAHQARAFETDRRVAVAHPALWQDPQGQGLRE